MRVVTHPRVLDPPTDERAATAAVDALLESPTVRLLKPGGRYWEILRGTVIDARIRGNLVHDAQLVALCREHGVDTLLTEDRDFRRFPAISIRSLGPVT